MIGTVLDEVAFGRTCQLDDPVLVVVSYQTFGSPRSSRAGHGTPTRLKKHSSKIDRPRTFFLMIFSLVLFHFRLHIYVDAEGQNRKTTGSKAKCVARPKTKLRDTTSPEIQGPKAEFTAETWVLNRFSVGRKFRVQFELEIEGPDTGLKASEGTHTHLGPVLRQ